MPETIDIAVVGATGLVGEALVELLQERDFPVGTLYLLATGESAGKSVAFRGRNLRVGNLSDFDFAKVRLAFLSTTADVAQASAEQAMAAGCSVIDLSGASQGAGGLPVLPAANAELLAQPSLPVRISAPCAPAAEVAEVLAALRNVLKVRQLSVTACLSASVLGREGVQELARQTAELLNARPLEPKLVDRQYAFNMLAQVGAVDEQGYSALERRMARELSALFPALREGLSVTCSPGAGFLRRCADAVVENGRPRFA